MIEQTLSFTNFEYSICNAFNYITQQYFYGISFEAAHNVRICGGWNFYFPWKIKRIWTLVYKFTYYARVFY